MSRRSLSLIALCAALAACAACAACSGPLEPTPPARAGRAFVPELTPLVGVRIGMNAAEVEEALGKPLQVDASGGDRTVLYYERGVVVLRGGKVGFSYATPPRGH